MAFKKMVVAGAVTATLGLGFWASQAFYTVAKRSIDAPEIDSCLGVEAKEELSKKIILQPPGMLKKNNLGIYSKCTQTQNPDNPKCNIKGNVRDGNKTYSVI